MRSIEVVRSPRLALAPTDDGYLAYDLKSRQLHRMNTAAALILELTSEPRVAADICSELTPLFGNTADGGKDWMRQAMAAGWLVPANRAPSSGDSVRSDEFSTAATRLRSDGEVLAAFVCQDYATALDPDCADGWCALGELAHIVGRRDRARGAYEKYLTLSPGDAEVELILRALSDDAPPTRAPDECIEQLYSRFAGFYEKNMLEELDYQAPLRIKELLLKFVGPSAALDILELGCGTGLAGQQLRPYARHLTGIDLSSDMVARAVTTGLYDELAVAEITAWLAQDARQFDGIVACDTLIYFGDLQQVIAPAVRHLRANGWIAFTVEYGESEPFKLTDSGRYAHTESHIRAVVRDVGLSIVCLENGFLRNEYGHRVIGLVALVRKS